MHSGRTITHAPCRSLRASVSTYGRQANEILVNTGFDSATRQTCIRFVRMARRERMRQPSIGRESCRLEEDRTLTRR